jgi:hypothetical protein
MPERLAVMSAADDWTAYRAQTEAMRVDLATYNAEMDAKIARYQVAWLESLAADHEAALIEDQAYEEARAAQRLAEYSAYVQRRAEYLAYLCMMSDHGCACVALGFYDWVRTQVTA